MSDEFPPDALAAYPPLIQRLLVRRGVRDAAAARSFLQREAAPLPDPWLLPDIEPAIRRLRRAIDDHELIAVYGDYDVDGLSAATILAEGLAGLGGRVTVHIPNRFDEGYGVTQAALDRLRQQGAALVVTVDCGISAARELANAAAGGMDAIVLDHHEVPEIMPRAVAVIDPKRPDATYPTAELCSGGLAFRLLQALYDACQRPLDESRYLDLAALATVCDMVPLTGENREIVKAGLPALARTSRPGLRALFEASGVQGDVDEGTLGFRIGPRLNAAGRLGGTEAALEALTTRDPARATHLARQLDLLNRQRQALVEAGAVLARSLAEQEPVDAPLLLLGAPQISRGIVGLIASRLVESFGRPAFVYEEGPEDSIGSARGCDGFDVVAAMRGAASHFLRFGGHRAAGGFAFRTSEAAALREQLWREAAAQFGDHRPRPVIAIDAETDLRAIDRRTLNHLAAFAPCGTGNPAPLLLSRGVDVVSRRPLSEGRHLRLGLRSGTMAWNAIAFDQAAAMAGLGARGDFVYAVDTGSRGYGPQLRIQDWRTTADQRHRPAEL